MSVVIRVQLQWDLNLDPALCCVFSSKPACHLGLTTELSLGVAIWNKKDHHCDESNNLYLKETN